MKINMKVFRRFIPAIVGLLVLPFFAQRAHATAVDFGCTGATNCASMITDMFSGGVLVSANDLTGITLVNGAGPVGDQGTNFLLAFDTTLSGTNIVLFDVGAGLTDLSGTILTKSGIQNLTPGVDLISLTVLWNSVSPDFAAFLGAPSGIGPVSNFILNVNDSVASVDVTITPTPEPGSLLLLGSGLLGVGGFLRRRIFGA